MTFIDDVKTKARHLIRQTKDQHVARQETSESDITPDAGVAGARANTDGNDGSYVGRTNPQFDAEVQQSGADARSEAERLSNDGP